jgi:archaellum component FlaC
MKRKMLTILIVTTLMLLVIGLPTIFSMINLPNMVVRAGETGNLQLTVDKMKGSPDDVITISGVAPWEGASVWVGFVNYTGYIRPAPGNYIPITYATVTAGTGGAFKTLMKIPHVPMNDTNKYAIYAYVLAFEANTYDYVLFAVEPRLIILPKTTVTPNETIYINGSGFPARATIILMVPNWYAVGNATTNERGDFIELVSWTVRDMPKGTYNLTATYRGVQIARAVFNIIPGLYYFDYDAKKWVNLYTISGPTTRDIEISRVPLQIQGKGFEANTNVWNITIQNIRYDYLRPIYKYNVTNVVRTDRNGTFRANITLGLTPGGTYNVIVITSDVYTFKGSLTINPYLEAYDYRRYSKEFDKRYNISASGRMDLKITSINATVIVFAWAFAPGNVTIKGSPPILVNATIFLDKEENTLPIIEVINGSKVGANVFLPDGNGSSVAIVKMPLTVTRGGHEIGQVQNITAPIALRFIARTNIWVGPTAFSYPPSGTVGPYTTIPYEYKGVGCVNGSIVGPFACLVSGTRTCHEKVEYDPTSYVEVKRGLGTEVTVNGSGFDPNMEVYVFIKGITVDLRTLYIQYFNKYSSLLQGLIPDGILVANTTTNGLGDFNVKFIMPTLPGANYSVIVLVRTVAGGFEEVHAGNFAVIPGLFINPAVAVGPYVAQVVSTGNRYGAVGMIKGVAFRTTNFDKISGGKYVQNCTDGITGVNSQVANWRITANGTLMSILSPYVFPGLFIPSLEAGVYEVRLILPDGNLTAPVHIGIINDVILITQIYERTAEISTNTGRILTSLDSLHAKIESINGTVAIIKTDVGIIKTDINNLKPIITEIRNNTVTIKTAVGTIETDVAAIKPVVTDIKDGVAKIQTTVGTIEGKVTSIDGNVATIMTDVGTIKADISTIKTDVSDIKEARVKVSVDMTPVWIAVVLSLIAAIAAIYAVITIRRKIAG